MSEHEPSPRARDLVALALASASVLALQVAATRLFSFLIWYHFAFLVLSIAFLGFTAGGLISGRSHAALGHGDPRPALARLGSVAGFSVVLAFVAFTRLPVDPFFEDAAGLVAFLLVVLVTLVPFACLGAYVCLALSVWSKGIGAVYGANLGGSALGCGLIVLLLDALGVPAAFLASGLLAVLAGLLSHWPRRPVGRLLAGLGVIAFVACIGVATDELHPLVYVKSAKAFPGIPRERIDARKSDSLSSVEVFDDQPALWAVSLLYGRPPPSMIGFVIDGWALTFAYNRAEAEAGDSVLGYLPAAMPHRLRKAHDVLVIGAGGGVDVLTALHFGAEHVTAIEINPIILEAVRDTYAEFTGSLYRDPRVEMHNAEGRHYLRRDPRKYDLVQLSGVDTFAASQAGAFALHENYLYTVEAMREYLRALRPGGVLTFTRWLYVPERQTLRLVAIADRALRDRGVKRPQDCIVVFEAGGLSFSLIKNEPFSQPQLSWLSREVQRLGFNLLYAPHVRVNPLKQLWGENPFYALWDMGPQRFVERYPLDIRPTIDDRPFFFEYQRWGGSVAADPILLKQNAQTVLLGTLAICSLLCAGLLWAASRRFRGASARLGLRAHLYFVALGLGYIFVENVLVQRIILFLGSPAHALTVILFSLLAASGLGSVLMSRSPWLQRHAPRAALATAGLLLLYAFGMRSMLDPLLGLALPARVAIVVALIAPLGLMMGMPFPSAIERLTQADARLVPWAWVINGTASVLGGIVTIMIAMTSGFTTVFVAAALLYALAALSSGGLEARTPA